MSGPLEFVGVTAGSLDDPSGFRQQMDFFFSDAQPWAFGLPTAQMKNSDAGNRRRAPWEFECLLTVTSL
jgi:hypothetical protein